MSSTAAPARVIMTPQEVLRHLETEVKYNRYYTLTSSQRPEAQWAPCSSHPHMESRPCHCSNSRTHKLLCGHIVVTPFSAEQCAANCAGMARALDEADKQRCSLAAEFASSILYIDHSTFEDMTRPRKTMDDVRQTACSVLLDRARRIQSEWGTSRDREIADMFLTHQANLFSRQVPRPDLIGGNFACEQCGIPGTRSSLPALIYWPKKIVVIQRTDTDAHVIGALEKGMRPEQIVKEQHRHAQRQQHFQNQQAGRGRGGHGGLQGNNTFGRGNFHNNSPRGRGNGGRGRGRGRGVIHGRVDKERERQNAISKFRREEKAKVLDNLDAEELYNKIESMGLGPSS